MKKPLAIVLWLIFFIVACGTLLDFNRVTEESGVASVCDYETIFIFRATFRPGEEGDKDFTYSLAEQVAWLWNHGYEVLDIDLKYGFDMTRSLILRHAVVKYKEVKNE